MDVLRYKVTSIEIMAEDTKIFRMKAEGEKIEYLPGHFAMIHSLDEQGKSAVSRPYSIASSPNQEHLEFCIKMIGGKMTTILDNAKVGQIFGVSGPMGHFLYEKQENCTFVAGGTGIAPFISMLRYIREEEIQGRFTLLYSTRSKNTLLYQEEITKMGRDERIKIITTLTREDPEGWDGEKGRIDEAMLVKYCGELKESSWFLCGPLKMTMKLRGYLLGEGVEESKIRFEGWG